MQKGYEEKKWITLDKNGFFSEKATLGNEDKIITSTDKEPCFIDEKGRWCAATNWKSVFGTFKALEYKLLDSQKHEYAIKDILK